MIIINELLAEASGKPLPDIHMDTDLNTELGLDSLDTVDVVNRLEVELGIKVPNRRIADLRTVGDIHRLVKELLRNV